jgi:hypothetical protein
MALLQSVDLLTGLSFVFFTDGLMLFRLSCAFVVLPPSFDFPPCIAETGEPVRVQTLVAQLALEAFDVGILSGLA